MGLKNLVIPETTIRYGEEDITVTGLDMEGIVILLQEDEETFRSLFEMDDLTLMKLIKIAPNFVAKMIATAAGEPNEVAQVKKLPLGIQLKLLEAVWELTVLDMDELGKVMGYLAEAVQGIRGGLVSETETNATTDPQPDPQMSS
jgi:hypothetical protein